MSKIHLFILFCTLYSSKVAGHPSISPEAFCENDSWHPFRDEKCIRIIDQFVHQDEAKAICDEFYGARLIKIDSQEEQDFLSQLIFEENQIIDSVWLGAVRVLNSPTEFQWENDGSGFRYSNWAPDSPSSDFEKNCTQLTSHLGQQKVENDGQWLDVSCLKRNLVVCQKSQNWSIVEMENAFFQLRYDFAEIKSQNEKLMSILNALHLTEPADSTSIKSCHDIQNPADYPAALSSQFVLRNKNHVIYPLGPDTPLEVRCDFEMDGGGWTIIQTRSSGPMDEFYLGWRDYEQGFGSVDGNYWLGLTAIHALTSSGAPQELRIDMEDFEGDIRFAKYRTFAVGNLTDFYRLSVGGFEGNAGDSLEYHHNGMRFSTFDVDNDMSANSCAQFKHGAWWYGNCAVSDLNAYYFVNGSSPNHDGIEWQTWKAESFTFKNVAMKIRPATE